MRKYSCSLIGKYTFIGSTFDTVVRIVVGETRLPTCVCAIPAMPSISDLTCVKPRFRMTP